MPMGFDSTEIVNLGMQFMDYGKKSPRDNRMHGRGFGNFCLDGRWFESRQCQDFFAWNLFPLIRDFESLKNM